MPKIFATRALDIPTFTVPNSPTVAQGLFLGAASAATAPPKTRATARPTTIRTLCMAIFLLQNRLLTCPIGTPSEGQKKGNA